MVIQTTLSRTYKIWKDRLRIWFTISLFDSNAKCTQLIHSADYKNIECTKLSISILNIHSNKFHTTPHINYVPKSVCVQLNQTSLHVSPTFVFARLLPRLSCIYFSSSCEMRGCWEGESKTSNHHMRNHREPRAPVM